MRRILMDAVRSLVVTLLAAGAALMAGKALAQGQQGPNAFAGIGRAATPTEVAAWDIDVRADFKGLPAGAGSVAKGQDVWEAKCASCHGVFGESTEVFNPLIGGTGAKDVASGRVASLLDPTFPGRTTLMKVSTVSTLWDYINRAMPWNNPKSLTVEEVYAVTAFMLNLSGVVPDDFTLSDRNIADVQKRLPNRNGMTTAHGLWPGREFKGTGKWDVQGSDCMRNCAAEPKVASLLPGFARNAHGNLAEQNRMVGPQRGADTTRPEGLVASAPGGTGARAPNTVAQAAPAGPSPSAADAQALARKHHCTACHAQDRKLVGPSWGEIAKRHAGKVDYLAGKIMIGGQGVWGPVMMPAQSLPAAEARAIADWLASGAGR